MRLFIADDQSRVRYALRVLLEKNPDILITGEAGSADSLQQLIYDAKPDILVIDWMLVNGQTTSLLRALKVDAPDLKIIVLSSRSDLKDEVLNAGGDAFISKTDPPDKLLAAIADS